jgi:hypothetical protein
MTNTQTEQDAPLPAVRDPDIERFRVVGWWLAQAESGGDDAKARGAGAALRLFYANELGLPPLAASEISIIKGKLVLGAKLLRAMAIRHGYRVAKIDSTPEACTAAVVRLDTGEELGRTTFTIDDAKTAGLIRERSAWITHPARMLWARAAKFALDDYAPEVTLGIYTEDEAAEIDGQPAPVPADTAGEPEDAEWEPVPEFGDTPAGQGAAEGKAAGKATK